MNKQRIRRLESYLQKEGFEALLFTSPENLRYASGFGGGEGVVILGAGKRILLTDSRYILQAEKEAEGFTVLEYTRRWEEVAAAIREAGIRRLGFESYHVTHETYRDLRRCTKKIFLAPLPKTVKSIRAIKEKEEVVRIRRAAGIAERGLAKIIPQIKPGAKERELALSLECQIRQEGADKVSFELIVVSGRRGACPHGAPGRKAIRRGEFVTIDFGAVYDGYCSDETCTVMVGQPKAEQIRVYGAVKEAHDEAIARVAPGVKFSEIDATARRVLEKAGLNTYFRHGTGHGVGLAVHEAPALYPLVAGEVETGMVFTVEPGVYIPHWGGVRIEDMVEVTRYGCELITRRSKKLLIL